MIWLKANLWWLWPLCVGVVGGSLIWAFSAADPLIVGVLSGVALAVAAIRRPPLA